MNTNVHDVAEDMLRFFRQSTSVLNDQFTKLLAGRKEDKLLLDDVYKHISQVAGPRSIFLTEALPECQFNTCPASEFRLKDQHNTRACMFQVTTMGLYLVMHGLNRQYVIGVVDSKGVGFHFRYHDSLEDVDIADLVFTGQHCVGVA